MNDKRTLRGQITSLVLRACKLKENQMRLGYAARDLAVLDAISRLREQIDGYAMQNDRFFAQWYVRQWPTLRQVMPSTSSRFRGVRADLETMHGYCLRITTAAPAGAVIAKPEHAAA